MYQQQPPRPTLFDLQVPLNHHQLKVVEKQRLRLQYRNQVGLTTDTHAQEDPSNFGRFQQQQQQQEGVASQRREEESLFFPGVPYHLLPPLEGPHPFELTSCGTFNDIGYLGGIEEAAFDDHHILYEDDTMVFQNSQTLPPPPVVALQRLVRTPPEVDRGISSGSSRPATQQQQPGGSPQRPARGPASGTPPQQPPPPSPGGGSPQRAAQGVQHGTTRPIRSPSGSPPVSNQSLLSPSEDGRVTPAREQRSPQQPAQPSSPPPPPRSTPIATPRRVSVGKAITMDDDPPRVDSTDDESGRSEEEEEEQVESDREEVEETPGTATVMTMLGEDTKRPRTRVFVGILDRLKESERDDQDSNPYAVTAERLRVLVGLGKLVERKFRAPDIFTNGFKNLLGREPRPSLERMWEAMDRGQDLLRLVPVGLRWLIVQLFLCFGAHDSRRVKRKVSDRVAGFIGDMADKRFASGYVMAAIESLIRVLVPSKGDTISDDSGVEHGTTTPLAVTAASVVGRGATTIVSSHGFFRTAPRANKRRGRRASGDDGSDSDVSSTSSSSSVKRQKRRRFDAAMPGVASTSGYVHPCPSDAGSPAGYAAPQPSATTPRPTAHTYPPVTETNSPSSRDAAARRPNAAASPAGDAVPQPSVRQARTEGIRQDTWTEEVFFVPFDRLFPEIGEWPRDAAAAAIDPSTILVDRRFVKPPKANPRWTLMTRLEPNATIAAATKRILLDVVRGVMEDPRTVLDFGMILRGLVKQITTAVLDHPTTELTKMIEFLSMENKSKRDKGAISFCVGALTLIHDSECALVKVPWNVLRDWCVVYKTYLNQAVQLTSEKMQEEGKTPRDVGHEFIAFRDKLEKELAEHFPDVLKICGQLSKISDVCVYFLFGLSVYAHENGDTIYTDALVKNTFLAWKRANKSPADFTKADNEKTAKVYWCMPLAFLTKTCGLNSAGKGRESPSPSTCPHMSFLEMGAEDSGDEGV